MKSFKSILCAALLALAVSSSAFAGNMTGKAPGNITGGTTNIAGNMTGRVGNITGLEDLILSFLIP